MGRAHENAALCVASHLKSLGETFTLARFADNLRTNGWEIQFLAFEFAAFFLRAQGFRVDVLGDDPAVNRNLLFEAVEKFNHRIILVSDLYLFESSDAARRWSNGWLFGFGVPVATFDHLNFYPDNRKLHLAFSRLLQGAGAEPFVFNICPLPSKLAAVVRPCPPHNPVDSRDARFFKVDASYAKALSFDRAKVRDQLGFTQNEKVVFVPVGSWSAGISPEFMAPYHNCYASLLSRYLSRGGCDIRLVLLGGNFKRSRSCDGRVCIEFFPSLPFDSVQELLRVSDLVVTDNIISSSMCRAVMEGIPAAAMMSSLDTVYDGKKHRFEAPFQLSEFVSNWLEKIEVQKPNSLYPFLVYPLGWKEELRVLLEQNPYCEAIEQIELFDEADASRRLNRLLMDRSARESQRMKQARFAQAVRNLAKPVSIVSEIIEGRAEHRPQETVH